LGHSRFRLLHTQLVILRLDLSDQLPALYNAAEIDRNAAQTPWDFDADGGLIERHE
jgi:hypothetical protein